MIHKVSFEIEGKKSPFFKIFPNSVRFGSLLRWDDLKKSFEYNMLVEVESDFNEEDGVNVFGLMLVEGSDGVYWRQVHEGFYLVRSFSRRSCSCSRIKFRCLELWKVVELFGK